ncbi:hypothetical protein ACH4U7_18545 [Streptomyces sp. NPDC020845]|uniref:hypothetical protein n=1 Tax=Streptomyces sp. NPDC020845 TaxID=3365096 RepID=UPI0037AA6FD7
MQLAVARRAVAAKRGGADPAAEDLRIVKLDIVHELRALCSLLGWWIVAVVLQTAAEGWLIANLTAAHATWTALDGFFVWAGTSWGFLALWIHTWTFHSHAKRYEATLRKFRPPLPDDPVREEAEALVASSRA